MKASEVKIVLESNNVKEVYHVNTVVTSLTFLKNNGIMSREYVEKTGLPQSPQESDEIDRKWGIYNDIFFDSVDIHDRIKNVNHYGPVTFVYSVDLLDELKEYDVSVTKNNPIHWKNGSQKEERYFTNFIELKNGFTKGAFCQHITVNDIDRISFKNLKKIIIDNPGEKGKVYLDKAVNAIKTVITESHLNILLEIRKCENSCDCLNTYDTKKEGYTYHRFKTKLY